MDVGGVLLSVEEGRSADKVRDLDDIVAALWALPVASLMLEKYLNGEISPERQYMEDRMMTTRFF